MKYMEIIVGIFLIGSIIFFIFVCEYTKKKIRTFKYYEVIITDINKITTKEIDASKITAIEIDASVIKWDDERKMFYIIERKE